MIPQDRSVKGSQVHSHLSTAIANTLVQATSNSGLDHSNNLPLFPDVQSIAHTVEDCRFKTWLKLLPNLQPFKDFLIYLVFKSRSLSTAHHAQHWLAPPASLTILPPLTPQVTNFQPHWPLFIIPTPHPMLVVTLTLLHMHFCLKQGSPRSLDCWLPLSL